MRIFSFLLLTILLNCEIPKNPLSPKGPFGVINLFYNLSKVGNWKYTDHEILYYNQNDSIIPNSPLIPSPGIANSFFVSENLPEGLSLNSSTGVISGTPTTILEEKEYTFYAKYNPFPDNKDNFAKLKLNVDYYAMTSGINKPFVTEFLFPDNFSYSNYSIEPTLPTGFSIHSQTGIISGPIRTVPENLGTYKVKAIRGDGVSVVGSSSLKATEWIQEAYLKAPNAEASDNFGISTSISGDTIVVGAQGEDSNQTTVTNGTTASANNSATDSGAVYVFRRTGNIWSQEAYLKAPNAEASDNFGTSVSISRDTIVVGVVFEDSNQTTVTNGSTASANNSAANSGAAYVFRRTGNLWAQEAYLKAPNAEADDSFGVSVSISGDTIVVSSHFEDSNQTTITNGSTASANNSAANSGAAYVFRRNGNIWSQEAYLKASNTEANDNFGNSVSISGDTIVVGAILEDSNQTTITNGTSSSANNSASNSGAAYVFRRNGNIWAQEAYLKAPNAEASDQFGNSVSISGDTIVVGAQGEDSNQTTITNGSTASANNSAANSGAAYVFRRTGNLWAQEAYLKAPNAEAGDTFGRVVSISGDTIVVGAQGEDSNQTTITNGSTSSANNSASESGATYVFRRNGNIWIQEAYLKAPNAEASDNFGRVVSISGDTIVVGASNEDSNQTTVTNGTTASANNSATDSGAAYVFRRR